MEVSLSVIDWIILILYMGGMLLIGFIANKKIEGMDDFILGGRRFTTPALVGTIVATMVGSGMLMGSVGNAYKYGNASGVFWIFMGGTAGYLVVSFLSKGIRKTGARSMAEIISVFGKPARLCAAVVVSLYGVSLVAINIAGLRTVIINLFSNLNISIITATIIAAVISISYTALGGFFAVVWTDVAQLLTMIVGILIIGPIIGVGLVDGGLGTISETYASEGMGFLNPLTTGLGWQYIFSIVLIYMLSIVGDPTMPQRALASKTTRFARNSFAISGFITLAMGVIIMILGGCIHCVIPELEASDAALPVFIGTYYPAAIKGICIAGMVAAIMSSFDSFLILSSTHIMYDIGKTLNPDLKDEKIAKSLPWLTVIIGALGIIVALYISRLLTVLSAVFSIVGSSLVPAMICAIFFKEKASKKAVTASIVVGAIVPTVLFFTLGYNVPFGDPVVTGLLSSIAVVVIGSLSLKDKLTPEELEVAKAKEIPEE